MTPYFLRHLNRNPLIVKCLPAIIQIQVSSLFGKGKFYIFPFSFYLATKLFCSFPDNNSIKQTNNLLNSKNSRLLEKMIVIPTSVDSSSFDKNKTIRFEIKLNNNNNKLTASSIPTTSKTTPTSLSISTSSTITPITPTTSLPSSPSSFLNASSYDCNMDSFKTNMTRKGFIMHVETNNLKNLFANSSLNNNNNCTSGLNTLNKTSTMSNNFGLLCNIKNAIKHVNIFDYVHSNDHNHINQHINNGN